MIQFQILTPWQISEEDGFHSVQPLLASKYALSAWQDVTGQPAANLVPSPNLFIVQALANAATYAQIENDPVFLILWSKEV